MLTSTRPNLTLCPFLHSRLSVAYRRDTLQSPIALDGANFAIIAAISCGLLILSILGKAAGKLGRPLLLQWLSVIGLSLLETFLASTFTAPIVPRPAIFDEASLSRTSASKQRLPRDQMGLY